MLFPRIVPKGKSPSIFPINSYTDAGKSIILNCSLTYSKLSHNDISTNLTIQWLNSSNHILHSYTSLNDYTEHTLNYTISNVKLSDAGQYTCQYNVSSNNFFVITSDVVNTTTNLSVQS